MDIRGHWYRIDTNLRGSFLVLASALLWSLSGLVYVNLDTATAWIVFIRSGIGGLVLLPFLIRSVKIRPVSWLVGACLSCALFIGSFVIGTKFSSSALTVAMQYSATLYVFIFQLIFTKHHKPWHRMGPMIVVALGIGLMIYDARASGSRMGLLFAIICGLSFAVYTACLRHLKTGSPLGIASASNLTTAAIFGLIILLTKPSAPQTSKEWSLLIIAGLFLTAVGYSLYSTAMKDIPPDRALILALVEPILNPFWIYLATGNHPTAMTIFGLMILLGGILLDILITKIRIRNRADLASPCPVCDQPVKLSGKISR